MNKRTWLQIILVLAVMSGGFIVANRLKQPIRPIIGIVFTCVGVLALIGALLLKLKIIGAVWGKSAIGSLFIGLGCIALGLTNLYGDVLSIGGQLALGLLSLLVIAGLVIELKVIKAQKT